MTAIRHTILLVDDERYGTQKLADCLEDKGCEVVTAPDVARAIDVIRKRRIDLAVIDLMLPLGKIDKTTGVDTLSTHAGFESGIVLARWILRNSPDVKFVGHSLAKVPSIVEWFHQYGAGFIFKTPDPARTAARIIRILGGPGPRSFIVHGRAEALKYELKNYLQNTLGLPEPVILHEQPSLGRTIIEKFEEESADVELVFVLLTPDDAMAAPDAANDQKRRARQNVIFELGYFLAKLGRRSGSVLLLYQSPLELPSDIAGLVYIDISNGIQSAGETIRRELGQSLQRRDVESAPPGPRT